MLLGVAAAAFTACKSDEVTESNLGPIAGVRFINAVADTGALDIRMIDQIELSAVGNSLNFRGGTEYYPTEAKARHIRVFPTSLNPAITSQILLDTTITITADTRVTLLLTGSARSKTLRFVVIEDDVTDPGAGNIAVRLVNAATGAVNGYVVTDSTSALGATPTQSNIAPLATSAYTTRTAGSVAIRVTNVGSTTVNAAAAGPTAAATIVGAFPAAGVNSAGTRLSAYYFPPGVPGSPQRAITAPSIVWFVDRNPADK
jgi:hypothetical protein